MDSGVWSCTEYGVCKAKYGIRIGPLHDAVWNIDYGSWRVARGGWNKESGMWKGYYVRWNRNYGARYPESGVCSIISYGLDYAT